MTLHPALVDLIKELSTLETASQPSRDFMANAITVARKGTGLPNATRRNVSKLARVDQTEPLTAVTTVASVAMMRASATPSMDIRMVVLPDIEQTKRLRASHGET